MPANIPDNGEGELTIGGNTYKIGKSTWTAEGKPLGKTFADVPGKVKLSGTLSGMLTFDVEPPSEYRRRRELPPQN